MGDSANNTNKDSSSEHINLKVQGQEGSIVHFKIKKSTPLRKLMNAYCERMVIYSFVRVINPCLSLEMEENDTIEVFQAQTGGC
ncbi:unnamed protein product [Echinostoma caproni]|uniref:Rad60-SLD domain-containing protein n=1 Tax=Echinostoma caproni TaxID=27848 RepID=A0A183BDI8_9TREM|nr:unnamed protein product [Echinostoma caproni]